MSQPDPALILFDAALLNDLQQNHRFPGNYVGVRKIRPSCREIQQKAFKADEPRVVLPPITFKVVTADGVERRMTAAEKKAAKEERKELYKAKLQLAKERQQQEAEAAAKETVDDTSDNGNESKQQSTNADDSDPRDETAINIALETSLKNRVAAQQLQGTNDMDRYYYLQPTKASIEQELADLRGERNTVPPVLLSPAQTHLLLHHSSTVTSNDSSPPPPVLDDVYAQTWATALRQSMQPAIATRQAEDMRAMVYDVVPQVWRRLRPAFDDDHVPPSVEDWASATTNRPTLQCHLQPTPNPDWGILMRALYRGRGLHVGCGAKFGSNVLLYDGPRHERHAFAGLRLVRRADLPFIRAYDLAGYVRCLNTAGKLALLATVIDEQRVAILDLALEKIDTSARTAKRVKTLEERIELLAKTTKKS